MSAYNVTVNGQTYLVTLKRRMGSALTFTMDEREYTVPVDSVPSGVGPDITIEPLPRDQRPQASASSKSALQPEVRAPLPGIVSDIKVLEGDTVEAGGTLVVIEAMKMENPIKAPTALRVTKVHVQKGQEIAHGAPLVSVEPV
jgi:biotin carboxyl carrier protein